MYVKLEGQKVLDYCDEVFIDENRGVYPLIYFFEGFLETETEFITLFGTFDAEDENYYIVMYITGWNSEKIEDVETIEDAIDWIEWVNVNYDVYASNERGDFFKLLETYEGGINEKVKI